MLFFICRIIFLYYLCIAISQGVLVQLVRIRACHARGQGFESPTHRRKGCKSSICEIYTLFSTPKTALRYDDSDVKFSGVRSQNPAYWSNIFPEHFRKHFCHRPAPDQTARAPFPEEKNSARTTPKRTSPCAVHGSQTYRHTPQDEDLISELPARKGPNTNPCNITPALHPHRKPFRRPHRRPLVRHQFST